MFKIISLDIYLNNKGISYQNEMKLANFSGAGSSLPAEQLPQSGSLIEIENVPFIFPLKEGSNFDNVELFNQRIEVECSNYNFLHILGTTENGSFIEPLKVFTSESEYYETKLGLSEWILEEPLYNEKIACRCNCMYSNRIGRIDSLTTTIWYQKIPLNSEKQVLYLEFPDNPGMHVFAITMEKGLYDE